LETKRNTIFWAVIACLLWSTAYPGIKLGLQYDKPLHFAGIRFIISGLMIFPFTVRPRLYLRMVWEHRRLIGLVTLLQTLISYICFYLGLNIVPGALGAVIVGSQPLVTAIVASLMQKDEILTRNKIITIIAGISGVILISAGRQAFRIGTSLEIVGVLLILCSNTATAISNVFVSVRNRGLNPLVLSSASLFTGGLVITIISHFTEQRPAEAFPAQYWLVLGWLSFMSAFAFSLWYLLLQRPGVRVSELNLWKFLIPVVGAILSWLLVPGEKPEWLTVTGMLIITASLLAFFLNRNHRQEKELT